VAKIRLGRFASLLRFSLNAQHSGLVPLAQELKIVRDYLEIEKTRFSERLRFAIAIPAAMEAVKVPPLALQTLVENCIKHVVARRAQGATIRVAGAMEAGRIRVGSDRRTDPDFHSATLRRSTGLATWLRAWSCSSETGASSM